MNDVHVSLAKKILNIVPTLCIADADRGRDIESLIRTYYVGVNTKKIDELILQITLQIACVLADSEAKIRKECSKEIPARTLFEFFAEFGTTLTPAEKRACIEHLSFLRLKETLSLLPLLEDPKK